MQRRVRVELTFLAIAAAGAFLQSTPAHADPVLISRCANDFLDPTTARLRLEWARACGTSVNIVSPTNPKPPAFAYLTLQLSSNGGIPLWEYIETDDFGGKNSYSGDIATVNEMFTQNQWRSGGIIATTVAGGFQKWTEDPALALARPSYPIFGNNQDINVATPLFPNPNYALHDCKFYTDAAATHLTDTSVTGFYMNGYCPSMRPIPQSFWSTDVPKSIPDNNPAGINSVINVPVGLRDILHVTVDVDITHTYVGDLVIQVISPNNQIATLSNREGGSVDNFIKSSMDISSNFTSTSSASGQWRLLVRDLAGADVGKINSFVLHITSDILNDFNITSNPMSSTIIAGASTTYTINTARLSGFPEIIALSVSGLPAGVTGSFNSASVAAGGNSTLTLRSTANTAAGTTPFTITGTATSATHTWAPLITITANQAPTVMITSPTNGSTVRGLVTVSATASDNDGVESVQFDLPDGTSVIDTLAPFSIMWNTTTVTEGSGYLIHATATDNWGAIGVATVAVTVNNCLDDTISATNIPLSIPPNDLIGITSLNDVKGNGTVASMSLFLNITHTAGATLIVTLISPPPSNTEFPVISGSLPGNIITTLPVSIPLNQVASGIWKLKVQSSTAGESGTPHAWSLAIVGNCSQTTHWSGTATPNLPTMDNRTACTNLTVATTAGNSSGTKLDIFGNHDFRSILRGTLAHNSVIVDAFPIDTFPGGSGTFSFINRTIPGTFGAPSGVWTLCLIDTDAGGDTGVLTAWSVHN